VCPVTPYIKDTFTVSSSDYASVVWDCLTSTDSAKLERIQRKLAALCYTDCLTL